VPSRPPWLLASQADARRAALGRGATRKPKAQIDWVEVTGYLAPLLVFCTFYMKTMIPLRCVAIASNVVFMTYGLAGGLYPVFRTAARALTGRLKMSYKHAT
jgi:hypothetical protein